jgi:hypothetical protein
MSGRQGRLDLLVVKGVAHSFGEQREANPPDDQPSSYAYEDGSSRLARLSGARMNREKAGPIRPTMEVVP